MGLENFFEAVVGSREGEFKPDFDNDVTEEELIEASQSEENELQFWKDRVSLPRLQEAKKRSTDEIRGGSNKVEFMTFDDGKSGIFKPSNGEDKNMRANIEQGTLYKRERAAYLVDRFFDFNIVPPTIIKEIDGNIGSLQRFIPDARACWEILGTPATNDRSFEEQMQVLWVFDLLIHNSDRNVQNFLFSGTVELSLHAIDNGCSFSKDQYQFSGTRFFDEKISDELLIKIEDFVGDTNRQKILHEFLLELLPEEEVDAFFKRVEKMGEILAKEHKIPKDKEYEITKF